MKHSDRVQSTPEYTRSNLVNRLYFVKCHVIIASCFLMMTNVSRSSDGDPKLFQESRSIEPREVHLMVFDCSTTHATCMCKYYYHLQSKNTHAQANSEFSGLVLCREQTMRLLGLCDGKKKKKKKHDTLLK